MDISKLPKLSQTQAQHRADTSDGKREPLPPPPPPPAFHTGTLAEAWISIAIGLILLIFLPHAPKLVMYVLDRPGFEQTYNFRDRQGQTIPYPQSAFFWEDLGVASFAAILVLEGIFILIARRWTLPLSLLLLGLVILLNLFVLIYVRSEIGFRIMPALAVAFGIYLLVVNWGRLKPTPSA